MADILLDPAIMSISGRVGKLMFKRTPSGKIRVYKYEKPLRKKPLTKGELEVRNRFKTAAKEFGQLTEEQRKDVYREWIAFQRKFNGKTYYTLRGYFVAKRIFELNHAADLEPLVIPQPVVITNKPS